MGQLGWVVRFHLQLCSYLPPRVLHQRRWGWGLFSSRLPGGGGPCRPAPVALWRRRGATRLRRVTNPRAWNAVV